MGMARTVLGLIHLVKFKEALHNKLLKVIEGFFVFPASKILNGVDVFRGGGLPTVCNGQFDLHLDNIFE